MFVITFWWVGSSVKKYLQAEGSMQKLNGCSIYMVLAADCARFKPCHFAIETTALKFFSVFTLLVLKEASIYRFHGYNSHTTTVGIIIAMFLYNKKNSKKPICGF
ncbi:MAG: hypothetical protein R2773_07255 [Flavobacteriaceae bacterium]